MKYRIKPSESLYSWILLQEKRWWGWKTVGRFLAERDGVHRALALKEELEKLET